MERYNSVRVDLQSGALAFVHLDAAQLVKHAYGLVTDARRIGRKPLLYYLFAEPNERAGQIISTDERARHRSEIRTFASAVVGDEVEFCSASYREWIGSWPRSGCVADHGNLLLERFQP